MYEPYWLNRRLKVSAALRNRLRSDLSAARLPVSFLLKLNTTRTNVRLAALDGTLV